jgi:hypothetical protein
VTLMRKMIILSRMPEKHTLRQGLNIIQIIQGQAVEMQIEPKPIMVRAGQVIIRHQRLINMVMDLMENDEHIGLPNLVTDEGGSGKYQWYAKF